MGTWLGVWVLVRISLKLETDREDGISGMEYAVVAAVVIVAVAGALRAGTPAINSIVSAAMTAVQGALTP
jgi:hypothetical protein